MAVSPFFPTLAEQCIDNVLFCSGKMKFSTEKIPFLISPVYAVPPISIIFLEKFRIEKFPCRVPSVAGSASNEGAAMMVHSGLSGKASIS
ncbi:hypothetical protein D9M68_507490 [compost metagenome]